MELAEIDLVLLLLSGLPMSEALLPRQDAASVLDRLRGVAMVVAESATAEREEALVPATDADVPPPPPQAVPPPPPPSPPAATSPIAGAD